VRFENEFEVAGSPSQVIERLDDVPMMASLLPGASVGPVNPDGSFPAELVVSFGPKRISFKGSVTNRVDRESCSGVLAGKASADVRGARMAVTMNYRLGDCPGSPAPRTSVKFVSEAQLTGMLAEFAKAGGVVVTNAIFAEFARRFSAQFAVADAARECAPEPAGALSTLSIAAQILRSWWLEMARWLRAPFRKSRQ
jgi:carbon monoxide dehydrogenase subunit G